MNAEQLKNTQAPLKEKYRQNPEAAIVTLSAEGSISDSLSCKVATGKAITEAGLHPATGGSGELACSGDMLLEALVACAGVTLAAVATALSIEISKGHIRAEGDLDFRGTLGVSKEAPVGFASICLFFEIDSNATPEQIESLAKLTERYCVVLQTISKGVPVQTAFN